MLTSVLGVVGCSERLEVGALTRAASDGGAATDGSSGGGAGASGCYTAGARTPPVMLVVLDRSLATNQPATGGVGRTWYQVAADTILRVSAAADAAPLLVGLQSYPARANGGAAGACQADGWSAAETLSPIRTATPVLQTQLVCTPGGGRAGGDPSCSETSVLAPLADALETGASYLHTAYQRAQVTPPVPITLLIVAASAPTCGADPVPSCEAARARAATAYLWGMESRVVATASAAADACLASVAQAGGRPPITAADAASLTTAIEAAFHEAAAVCRIRLDVTGPRGSSPEIRELRVRGEVTPRDSAHADGYDLRSAEDGSPYLELYGSACTRFATAGGAPVAVSCR